MLAFTLAIVAATLQVPTTPSASSDAPFVAVAKAFQEAWNRHDMDALADVVAEDVDFITRGGRWLKGRPAFKKHHAELHAKGRRDATLEIRATHVQRLTSDIVLMHVEWTERGDTNPDGTPRAPSTDGIFTWILAESGGRWRIRASHNTAITIPPAPAK